MNLKKSDKMIAGIAVAILIIAAIGIIMYTEEEDETPVTDDKDDKMMYSIESNLIPVSEDIKEAKNIKPKVLGTYSENFKYDLDGDNIKNITFSISYADKNPGILGLLKIGKDTFTLTIKDSEGNKVGSGQRKGQGSFNIEVDCNAKEITGPIEAESFDEAKMMLEDQFVHFNETYSFNVQLKGGLFGRIRERILGKDTYSVSVTYHYYNYKDPVEMHEDNDDNNPTDIKPSDYKHTVYSSICTTGFH